MRLVNLLEWNLSLKQYSVWCNENKIPCLRVNLTKVRMKEEDYVFFKMKFDKVECKRPSEYD